MSSFFGQVKVVPPSMVLGLALECSQDEDPDKIDLIIGEICARHLLEKLPFFIIPYILFCTRCIPR